MSLVVERLKPYMAGDKEPALKNYYIITWPNGGTIGVRAKDQGKVAELETLVRDEILKDLPDTQAFAMQGNLFGGFGNGRSIDVRLQATDQEGLTIAAQAGLDLLRETFPGANVRVNPDLEQAEPEIQLYPNDSRMMEVRVKLNPGDFAIGSAVRVALPHSEFHDALTVPRDALVLRKSGAFIYQVDEKKLAQKIAVTTGIGAGDRIEVFGEIVASNPVVVRGAERLKTGQQVRYLDRHEQLAQLN